ncbi:cellulose biosynthesis cyclic di-GMP-binding regulatory protein BcsB [uncultured Maricaulis sp.]|uniref:cellulose biosynthesis cyclic di-GMP-binding regulatory protein BcsB n=1 Tax=uncultured Maricaulis sp. TaxID=174710 RepID=UPI002634BE0B|nr:cellulose biosynthesis cyclic di-GMP-binding regulatory protein BcsB [uncultured Maricaulis sp.]
MFVRVLSSAVAALAILASGPMAVWGQDNPAASAVETIPVNTEERSLADLDGGSNAFILSTSRERAQIHFSLPPNVDTTEAWLRLAARPASDSTSGLIHVSVNGGEAITIRPQARAMEARFALFSADFRAGDNTLEIAYTTDTPAAGWIVDARRSQMRLTLEPVAAIDTLDDLEHALGADYAAPRRIALLTEDSRERVTLEALVAQGLALRAGQVPLFTANAEEADLVVRIGDNARLAADDRAALRSGDLSTGPEIAFRNDGIPHLIITGRYLDEATAAARLMAARSFDGYQRSFLASDAMTATRLGTRQVRDARTLHANADLRTFADTGLPFSADQGSRTAVQFSTRFDADRHGALSVMARAALISGEAWLYAWYGDADATAPANHNLLVIGPGSTEIAAIDRNAPAELRAALRAAERSRGQRGLMRLAAAAYADAGDVEAGAEVGIGVASLFRDQANQSRWIATLTAPDIASFEAAGRSLARSDLWMALEGRAAVWSARGVTALDYAVVSPTLSERAREFAVDHTRDAAFILFGAAFLLLMRGFLGRRKRVSAQS